MDETTVPAPVDAAEPTAPPAALPQPPQMLRSPWLAVPFEDAESAYPIRTENFRDPVKFPGWVVPFACHGMDGLEALAARDAGRALVAHYVEGQPAEGGRPASPPQPFTLTDVNGKTLHLTLSRTLCRILGNLEGMQARVPEAERLSREAVVDFARRSNGVIFDGICTFATQVQNESDQGNASQAAPPPSSPSPAAATDSPTQA